MESFHINFLVFIRFKHRRSSRNMLWTDGLTEIWGGIDNDRIFIFFWVNISFNYVALQVLLGGFSYLCTGSLSVSILNANVG